MDRNEKYYHDQVIIGKLRFGVDYDKKQLLPLDEQNPIIPFEAFQSDGIGNRVLADNMEYWPCFTGFDYSPDEDFKLPDWVLENPFHQDVARMESINLDCKVNGYILVNEATRNRLDKEILTAIEIDGKLWYANGYVGVLDDGKVDGEIMRFPFNDDYSDQSDDRYLILFYDRHKGFRDDVVFDEDTIHLPKNVFPIRMLHINQLDPVGNAISYKEDKIGVLYDSPIQGLHHAQKLSWADIGWLEEINKNRKALGLKPIIEKAKKKTQRKGLGH